MNEDLDVMELDDDLLDLVAAERPIESPPESAAARVFAAVSARIAGAPDGGGGGPTSGGGPAAPPRGAGRAGPLRHLAPLAGAFAVGGATVGVVWVLAGRAAEPVKVVYVDRVVQVPASPGPIALPASTDASGEPVSVAPSSLARVASPPAHPRGPSATPLASASGDRLAAERALLDVARGGLASGEPEKALAAVQRHERDFAHGALVEEREAILVKALVMAGRGDEARARGAAFRTRYPRSIMLNAVESSLKTIP